MVQNRNVYMSVETLAIIISAAGLFVTLGGGLLAGFAWIIRRTDSQFAELRSEFREEFRRVNEEFRVVHNELRLLRGELTEVKVAVARLEGPREQLILPRGVAS